MTTNAIDIKVATPGEWGCGCGQSKRFIYAEIQPGQSENAVVGRAEDGIHIGTAASEANARLFANSKRMDAAIRGLLDIIHDSMTHAAQTHHADAINAARKAIGLAVQG